MNKFQKRLMKLSRNHTHALVLGSAFGILDQILEVYGTVFVISEAPPAIKARNLIYKENFVKLDHLQDMTSIFVDIDQLDHLDKVEVIWRKHNSKLFVEGTDRVENNKVKILYDSGWACTSLQPWFHVWEQYRK
jgi:hypothetical protein